VTRGTTDNYANYCSRCGKQSYISRRIARRVRKRVPDEPGRGPPNAYPCPHSDRYWHLGHLPPIEDARDALRARRGAS
jgi:hypothetical protein